MEVSSYGQHYKVWSSYDTVIYLLITHILLKDAIFFFQAKILACTVKVMECNVIIFSWHFSTNILYGSKACFIWNSNLTGKEEIIGYSEYKICYCMFNSLRFIGAIASVISIIYVEDDGSCVACSAPSYYLN